jgi:hypothetical protein
MKHMEETMAVWRSLSKPRTANDDRRPRSLARLACLLASIALCVAPGSRLQAQEPGYISDLIPRWP